MCNAHFGCCAAGSTIRNVRQVDALTGLYSAASKAPPPTAYPHLEARDIAIQQQEAVAGDACTCVNRNPRARGELSLAVNVRHRTTTNAMSALELLELLRRHPGNVTINNLLSRYDNEP